MIISDGDKVRYIGGDPIALTYRGHANPKDLVIGQVYTVSKVHVADWYTDFWLEGIDTDGYRGFNSVLFEFVEDWSGRTHGLSIRQLVTDSYQNAYAHGFWQDAGVDVEGSRFDIIGGCTCGEWPCECQPVPDKYIISTKLALIHSEVTEALEEVRDASLASLTETRYTESGKPEGFGPELADAVIRIADLAGYLGIDLEAVVAEKQAYNCGRPFMHGRTI